MAATFTAPLAGILVAIELLLFELQARSFIPVALATAVATGVRIHFSGWAPLFPTPAFRITGINELWLFALMGIFMGMIGIAMIQVLSWLEFFFDELPIKRALIWSPVIGALILGVIGYFYPAVLGTSYDTIRDRLNDRLTVRELIGRPFAKVAALVISLGSGTTGGVFAPSLVVGGGLIWWYCPEPLSPASSSFSNSAIIPIRYFLSSFA
jgi:chloride channel protein, CIC family